MHSVRKTRRVGIVLVALLVVLVCAFAWLSSGRTRPTGPADTSLGSVADSLQSLSELEVIDRRGQSIPQYSRDEFGQRWADTDHNGCDTRNDILRRDLSDLQMKSSSAQCVVVGGTLRDPYTGSQISFQRGEHSSEAVQIDHVVALANAWKSGAWQWDATKRQEFANDPLNLLAVDGQANHDKGASSADQWLPSYEAFQCAYVQRQIAVKKAWGLGITRSEKKAMTSVLERCQ